MEITIPQRGIVVPKIALISGRYYGARQFYGGSATATALVANTFYAAPFFTPVNFTADRITLNVTVAGAAGKLLRLGIYTATPAGLPDALLVDSGALAADTAAPFIASATISQALIAGQLYFLAVVTDGTPTVTTSQPVVGPYGATDAADTGFRLGMTRAFSYAALPASWGTPTFYTTLVPHVALRVA